MERIVLKDLLNEKRFHSNDIDVIWSKEKKEKIFIINECICVVSETDFASDIDFRKTSCDPKYIAKNFSDDVSWCIEQNTLKM